MTIQVCSTALAKSKAVLQAALNEDASKVRFANPTPRGTDYFHGDSVEAGAGFAVVMDHPRRTRFAKVERKADGSWRVS